MKKLLYIIMCTALSASFIGCSSADANDNEMTNGSFAAEVSEYFPTDSLYHLYNGYAETGFEVRFDGADMSEGITVYKYKGTMNDERHEDADEKREFNVSYTVSGDNIVEHVENSDVLAESSCNVYSKIEDFIVLLGSIEDGNSWEQAVTFDGKPANAITTVKNVTEDSFTTVTEIEAEGYKDGKYTEERTYTKGSGLTSFSNTPYGSDEDDSLIFGYGFSIANEVSVTGMM